MKSKTYLHSYSNHDLYLVLNDNKYDLYAKGDLTYKKIIEVDSYDSKGIFLGLFRDSEVFIKNGCEKLNKENHIIQLNYDFIEIPVGDINTQEEVLNLENILVRSGLKNKKKLLYYDEFDRNERYRAKEEVRNETFSQPIEINDVGITYNVTNPLKSKILNFDGKLYYQNYLKALDKYPDHIDQINRIFDLNCLFIESYFNVNKNQIIRGFNIRSKMLEKLNRRITKRLKINY